MPKNARKQFDLVKHAAFNDELEKVAGVFGLIGRGLETVGSRLVGGAAKGLSSVSNATKLVAPTKAALNAGPKGLLNRAANKGQELLWRGAQKGTQALGGAGNLNKAVGGAAIGTAALGAGSLMSGRRRSLAPQAAYPRY